jgi:hypothetical protein
MQSLIDAMRSPDLYENTGIYCVGEFSEKYEEIFAKVIDSMLNSSVLVLERHNFVLTLNLLDEDFYEHENITYEAQDYEFRYESSTRIITGDYKYRNGFNISLCENYSRSKAIINSDVIRNKSAR